MLSILLQSQGILSTHITVLDIAVFLLLILGGYKGFQKGFLVELVAILIFFITVLLVFKLLEWGFVSSKQYTDGFQKATPFFVFFVSYCFILLFMMWLTKILKESITFEVFEGFDSIVGMILGAFKYALAIAFGLDLFASVGMIDRVAMNNTIFFPILMKILYSILNGLSSIMPFIGEMFNSIKQMLR